MTPSDGDDAPLLEYRRQVLRELDQIRADVSVLNTKIGNGLTARLNALEIRMTTLEVEFGPIKKLLWGLVAIILTTITIAILALVVKSGGTFR